MSIQSDDLPQILLRLKEGQDAYYQRECIVDGREIVSNFKQILDTPTLISKGVPTLQRGVYKPITPMLRHRFEFAGRWKKAVPGLDFLNLEDMEAVWDDSNILEQIGIRRENWELSPPTLPLLNVTLFAINIPQCEEIYLVWNDVEPEPALWSYGGNHERVLANIGEYFDRWAKFYWEEQ